MFSQHASPRSWISVVAVLAISVPCRAADFQIAPAAVTLYGNFDRAQLVVTERAASGVVNERSADLTHQGVYLSSDPRIVTVSDSGLLRARTNGTATVTVSVAAVAHPVAVTVKGIVVRPAIDFKEHVMPILAKAGCNAGACHASQYGKGGFKLSVFGFAPDDDYRAIVRDSLGRRVSKIAPASSLLLLKPTGGVPHEGGQRLHVGSVDYQVLEQWLASGAPPAAAKAAKAASLRIGPSRRVGPVGFTQQLQIVATYDNGQTRDVTPLAKFDSMDEGVLRVTRGGRVTTVGRGQGVALVRFEDQAEIATFVVPYSDAVDLAGWTDNNFIDSLAAAKFREIGISPSPLCDDATFLRRAYLDATGTLPTPEQAIAFLDSKAPDKRNQLIDALLGLTGDPAQDVHNNDYAAFWALKWSDLIRSTSATLGEQGMWALHNWLTTSFRENKPFDRFVRELITAQRLDLQQRPGQLLSHRQQSAGSARKRPRSCSWASGSSAPSAIIIRSRHSARRITIASRPSSRGSATRAARNSASSAARPIILVGSSGEVGHPRTGQVMKPTPLHGKPAAETRDRRQALADWLTAKDNPYFARNIVNRYVAYLLGRGLVEPIDDLRATNPPSNVALMDALAAEFIKSGYNVKHLMRTIMRSRLYQLDSQPTKSNASDSRFYSHYNVKRLAAEPLLDAVDAATGVQTKFEKVPLGTRAIELPDARYNNYFLNTFGKPRREGVCECERVSDPNLAQALHTLNGDIVTAKITGAKGRVAQLLAAKKSARRDCHRTVSRHSEPPPQLR